MLHKKRFHKEGLFVQHSAPVTSLSTLRHHLLRYLTLFEGTYVSRNSTPDPPTSAYGERKQILGGHAEAVHD